MERVLEVIYSNGVFTPLEPIDLPEHKRITITLHLPASEEPAEVSPAKPKTPLGQKLWEIRARIVTSGESLLDWEDVEQEIVERRGGLMEPDKLIHRTNMIEVVSIQNVK